MRGILTETVVPQTTPRPTKIYSPDIVEEIYFDSCFQSGGILYLKTGAFGIRAVDANHFRILP